MAANTLLLISLIKQICLAALLLLAASCREQQPSSDQRRNIKVKHDANAMRLINPHAWTSTTLVINKQEFSGVLGVDPFYIELPGHNAILFTTRDKAGQTTVHIYDFVQSKATSIEAGAISFGQAIGLNHLNDRDYVESITSNHLVVASMFLKRKTVWHLDLEQRKLTHKEVFDHDAGGNVTNRVVVQMDEGKTK